MGSVSIHVVMMAALVAGSGCVEKHRYHDTVATVAVSGSMDVGVATVDQRPYVVNQDKAPTFVGRAGGGWGDPVDVSTESGQPLAADFTRSICSSLAQKGYRCSALQSPPPARAREAVLADAGGTSRILLVSIREWRVDTMEITSLTFDVTLDVFDRSGTALAQIRLDGRDDLGGSMETGNRPTHARTAVPIVYRSKLERLLNDAGVMRALVSP